MVPAGAAISEILELEWCEESDASSLREIIAKTRSSVSSQEGC